MQVFTPLIIEKNKQFNRAVAMLVSVVCVMLLLSQTVFAQRTFVITDGDQVKVHTSFASDPARVLNEAGVTLEAVDQFTTQAVDGVSEITVQRGQVITIDNCGERLEVGSFGEDLETLLKRLGVPYGGDYRVSLPLTVQTQDGMEVKVEHVVENREVYTVDVPYETTYCYDPTLPAGERKVLIAGITGQTCYEARVKYVNRQETGRTIIQETVLQEPVNEIVVEGTGKALTGHADMPAIGDGVIVTADGQVLTYNNVLHIVCTAYTKTDEGCDDWTATGTPARVGAVAVDPDLIPYGTKMFIVANDGSYVYGYASAEDCGGAIQGNRIDLYYDTTAECFQFGVRTCSVYILD